jgi:hypothetical protein
MCMVASYKNNMEEEEKEQEIEQKQEQEREKAAATFCVCLLLATSVRCHMPPESDLTRMPGRGVDCTPRFTNGNHHALSEITFASPAINQYARHKPIVWTC